MRYLSVAIYMLAMLSDIAFSECTTLRGATFYYWRAGASQPSRSDFAHTVIPIQRQHAHKIATSTPCTGQISKEDASRFRKRRGRGDTIIQMPS